MAILNFLNLGRTRIYGPAARFMAWGRSHCRAGVVKLVDAPDSKSGSARSVGSIPTTRTTFQADHGGLRLDAGKIVRQHILE